MAALNINSDNVGAEGGESSLEREWTAWKVRQQETLFSAADNVYSTWPDIQPCLLLFISNNTTVCRLQ
jgi:hypothetical protein